MKINPILILLIFVTLVYSNNLLVRGKAKKTLSSTHSVLKFQIVGSDKNPSKSIAKAEAIIQKLKKSLKGMVDRQNIKITPPQVELQATNQGKVAFYESIIQIQMTTSRPIGEVIDVADKFGTLIDVTYRTSEREEVRSQLVEQAFRIASEKAQKYAQSIGVQLDGVELIEINDEIPTENDPFTVGVQVQLLFNLYNDLEQDQDDKNTISQIGQSLKGTQLVTEDETQYEQIDGDHQGVEQTNTKEEEIEQKQKQEPKKQKKQKNQKKKKDEKEQDLL